MSTKKLQILNTIIKKAEEADTLDGKHASEFAAASDVEQLKAQVGDSAVSEQISDAFDDAITGLSVSGKTITYTKGDNSTGTITTQDTVYSAATTSAAGLMSAADKTKLDGITTGATKIYVQNDEPTDAAEGAVWIDMDDTGLEIDIVQATGDSTTSVMSQKAVTDAISAMVGNTNFVTEDDLSALSSEVDVVSANLETLSGEVDTLKTDVSEVQTLVGDTSVSEQINNAVENKADKTELDALETSLKSAVVTLTADGWIGDAAPCFQVVVVDGMTADWVPGVPVIVAGDTKEGNQAMQTALSCVSQIVSDENALSFICYENKPESDMTIRVPGVMV